MKLATVPGLPTERRELALFVDGIGDWLAKMGGKITDVGYCFPDDYAELVCESPDGTQLEIRVKIL